MAIVIAITSGKGGVGKTNIVVNLGLALAERQAKVCVFDADTSLANINILLGIHPQYTLEQVLNGDKSLAEIMVRTAGSLAVVPAASGVQQCANLTTRQRQILIAALLELEQNFDYILIDTAAGVDSSVLDFVSSAQYRIIVITQEPTSLTDSFALVKMLLHRGCKANLCVMVNQVKDYRASQKVFKRFQQAVDKFLQVKLHFLGYLADDDAVKNAVRQQVPVVLSSPGSSVSCCFFALADIVKKQFVNNKKRPYFSQYWQKTALGNRQKTALENQIANKLKLHSKLPAKVRLKNHEVLELLHQQSFSEAQIRNIVIKLEKIFEHQFHKPLNDPANKLLEKMKDNNFTREAFSGLLTQFEQIYQARFGTRFFADGEQLLNQIFQLLTHKD